MRTGQMVRLTTHGRFLATLACVTAVVACSDGSPAALSRDLSEAEVAELVASLAVAHAFDAQFGETSPWPCPGGGVVAFSIGYARTDEAILAFVGADYRACRVDSWALNGLLELRREFLRDGGGSGESRGTIEWEIGGRSGTCEIDLATPSVEEMYTVAGSACGHEVMQTVP